MIVAGSGIGEPRAKVANPLAMTHNINSPIKTRTPSPSMTSGPDAMMEATADASRPMSSISSPLRPAQTLVGGEDHDDYEISAEQQLETDQHVGKLENGL